jgi:hypothetical protein
MRESGDWDDIYVPQTKFWEHIVFTILQSSFSSPVPFCPGMFSETTEGINMKLFRMIV